MAYARRSQQHRDSTSPPTRKYPLRRSPGSHKRRSTSEDPRNSANIRQVLVALHPNLRSRRPFTQTNPIDKEDSMARHAAHAGTKRKRVASVNGRNENLSHSTRNRTRSKRLRSDSLSSTRHRDYATSSEDGERFEQGEQDEEGEQNEDDDEVVRSEMDVDNSTTRGSASEGSESESNGEEDDEDAEPLSDNGDEDDSTDDHLLNTAQPKQLSRLRKNDLIRLYALAGLSDDAEVMTKSDIIDAIISARDDFASLPPSSPPRGDGYSSEGCSSDDGNFAGDEETDAGTSLSGASGSRLLNGHMGLRRRATVGEIKGSSKSLKNRSFSMGHLLPQHQQNGLRKSSGRSEASSKRRSSNRSSPTTSTAPSTDSPLVNRLRSRKMSGSSAVSVSIPIAKPRGKGKGKQVDFIEEPVTVKPSSKQAQQKQQEREREIARTLLQAEESDLTELEELEASLTKPSPRRLRSKDREMESDAKKQLRRTPMRTAKGKIKSLRESDDDEDIMHSGEEEDELLDEGKTDVEEEDEDELVSSASATPVPTPRPVYKGRRTPLRTRLRPRQRPAPPPPSDGDDEGEEIEVEQVMDEELDDVEEGDEGTNDNVEGEDDEETIAVTPRKLRNGKIVGEDVDMEDGESIGDDDEADEAEDMEAAEAEAEEDAGGEGEDSVEEITVDAEGETDDDETMEAEDDIDLAVATAKTLVRLRRDDLVRLCESRDLEPVGTKPQLAEALLQWRDRQGNEFSSPSSSGTVRASSSRRRRRNGKNSGGSQRSGRTHAGEPTTPVPTQVQREKEKLEKEPDQELELDLESLGLEDREIPPEKIQKLEKIGSGGFKDVFIGKFKGRKIAISEFRGQLSAMDIKELKLLGGFDHPNIVRFLGVSIPENTRETPVMIVSELCSNGDLFDYIRNVNPPTLHKVLVIMLDIARGLDYLHLRKPSVIHRDCKSSNILITAKGTAKIADFGLAKVKQSTRSMVRSLVGTVNWQAPELWHAHPKYNHKVDVFSCAMVFWEMLQWHLPNKKFPWEGMNEHAIYDIVGSKRQRPSVSGLRKQWSPELVDLMERMWAQEHQDRPTMSEVVEALEELVNNR